jgi:branched-chain amino acid transport system substrate-binding protein
MAVDKINASGGVLGRQFKLDPHDDDASATVSGQLYEKLIAAGAIAIAGSPDTGPVTAQLAIRHKFPTIGVVYDGGLTVNTEGPNAPPNPWVFDFGLNTFAGARRSANMRSSIAPTASRCCMTRRLMVRAGYMASNSRTTKRARKSDRPPNTENWSTGATTGLMPEVNAVKAAGIKCLDAWLTPQDQAAFVQDLHSAGYNAAVFGNDETNADDTFSKLAGDLADGTISAVLTSDLHPSPELTPLREEYKRRFNIDPTPFAETSFDSI